MIAEEFAYNPTTVDRAIEEHIARGVPISECLFRPGSESFLDFYNKVRTMTESMDLCEDDLELLETDIGQTVVVDGQTVMLDVPYEELDEAEYQGKKVELNKPKRGGSKKFYVYVKDGDKVKKVSFGAKDGGGNLAVKLRDPEARKNFAARHNCPQKNDKTSAGYWSCRLPRYAKSLGLSGGGTWW